MEFSVETLERILELLEKSPDPRSTIITFLQEHGFEVSEKENGSIFALLLGDMPSKEGSCFGASYLNLPSAAQLLAVAEKVTEKFDYKNRLHHPDIELVFTEDFTKEHEPDFMKIYAQNAYLLEKEDSIGTLSYATDPIITDRYSLAVQGLRNPYQEKQESASEVAAEFASREIRTASVSFGLSTEEYAKNASVMLLLSVAYQE